ncbi:MAG: ribulose-phosphate 3-epimerase [Planctomycetota bacterium]
MPPRINNLLTDPAKSGRSLPLIAPSILASDFAHLADECAHALGEGGADLLHVDVMDGHFVPNLTLGPALVASLRKALPEAFLDVHVMVTDPQQYLEPFAEAGADHYTFHWEPSVDPHAGAGLSPLSQGYDVLGLGDRCRAAGMSAGLAINPDTAVNQALLDAIPAFELVLVMSVFPGFGGQAFMPEVLPKVERLRAALEPHQRLQMDGGIDPRTVSACKEAGCDVLVAGSAFFGQPKGERASVSTSLRG